MKNLSGAANWFTPEKDIVNLETPIETAITIDNRVVLTYPDNGGFYFLSSDGKPLVFKNIKKAETYIKKNNLENYEIDNFQDYDFTNIELIEL